MADLRAKPTFGERVDIVAAALDGDVSVFTKADPDSRTPRTPDPEDGGCDICDNPACYRNQGVADARHTADLGALLMARDLLREGQPALAESQLTTYLQRYGK